MPESTAVSSSVAISDRLRNLPQYLLPQRLSTRLIFRLARVQWPWLKNALIRGFARYFQINWNEALESKPQAYADFNAFFTRALKPEARPLAHGETTVCCPVDGTISQIGCAEADRLLQAKGQYFSLTALLGGDAEQARLFQNGPFTTLYLSPRDYHRIHMPLTGQLRAMTHIPGRLFSVSPLTTRVTPELFARNERVVTLFDTVLGPMALVLVGAINVASIETVWAGAITPPLGSTIQRWTYPLDGAGSVKLERGAEMGRFNLGSTVILLFGPETVGWEREAGAGVQVRMGQRLGKGIKSMV